jgi:transcriptional regulator with XRE-family HTH domain
MPKAIGSRIKYLRSNILKKNQKDFAESIFISQSYLSKIENGNPEINDSTIFLITILYNVNDLWLRFGTGDIINHSNELFKSIALIYDLTEEQVAFIDFFVNSDQSTRNRTIRIKDIFKD